MPFSSENLLKELDNPETINWSSELKNRSESFSFLIQAIKGEQLNKNQFRNALHMIFRMAFPENTGEALQALVDQTTHPDIALRSEAVQLAIGLVRVSKNLRTPTLFSKAQEKAVRDAIDQGLTRKVAALAKKFFAG